MLATLPRFGVGWRVRILDGRVEAGFVLGIRLIINAFEAFELLED